MIYSKYKYIIIYNLSTFAFCCYHVREYFNLNGGIDFDN